MTTYTYPQVSTDGYRWNMLKRCLWEVGIEPVATGDSGGTTFLTFDRDLTAQEKAALDALMNDNPTFPRSSDVLIFRIDDIWEKFEQFKANAGLPNLRLYYTESSPGSGHIDTIELWNPVALTNQQKNQLKSLYASLLK